MTHDLWFMVALRLLIGSAAVYILSRGRCLRFDRKYLSLFLMIGTWIAFTFLPQAVGLRGTSVANSAVITAMFVVLTPLLLQILKKGKPSKFQWLGSLIGLLAFFILGAAQGFSSLNWYDAATFITALAVAFHTVYFTEVLKQPKNLYPIIFYQFLIAAVILFVGHFVYASLDSATAFFPAITRKEFLGILYLGIFTSAIPYSLQAYAQLNVSPIQVVLVISSEPLWAIGEANLIRGDPISGAALFTSGLLLIANFVAELKTKNAA
jgi:drug/metabolite transporter (DMT)-like permease